MLAPVREDPCFSGVFPTTDQALAVASPDHTFLTNVDAVGSILYHVNRATGQDDPIRDGSVNNPWRTIPYALGRLQPLAQVQVGQGIVVHAGVYPEPITTPMDGSPNQPFWLVAAPDENVVLQCPANTALPQPDGSNVAQGVMLRVNHRYWLIEDLELDGGLDTQVNGQTVHAPRWIRGIVIDGSNLGNPVGPDPFQHVVVHNVRIHDVGGSYAIGLVGAKHATVQHCTILNNRRYVNDQGNNQRWDCHGINVLEGSEVVLLSHNTLSGNSGDSVQVAHSQDRGLPVANRTVPAPRQIAIRENRCWADDENAIDLKSCDQVTVANNEFFNYSPNHDITDGTPIVVHYDAHNILIEHNHIANTTIAISVNDADQANWGETLGPIVIRRNSIAEVVPNARGRSHGIYAAQLTGGLEIYENRFHNIRGNAITLNAEGPGAPVLDAWIINNLFVNAASVPNASGINFFRQASPAGPVLTNLRSDCNLFQNASLVLNNNLVPLATWQGWVMTAIRRCSRRPRKRD
jgi:hypothetical protein